MLIYFVNLLISLKLKSWENSSVNEITNYIPSDEDLNYPAKLEQLAEKKSETTSSHYFCCFNAFCIYTLESILFLGFAFSYVFTLCYMALAKSDGMGLHLANYIPSDEDLNYPAKLEQLAEKKSETTSADEFQFKTRYPPLVKTPSCLSKLYRCLEPAVFTGLAQVTTVKVSLSSAGQNQRVDSVMGKPLKEQAFATPDKVVELVQKVNTAIQQVLPPVMAKMKLYLQNPSTRTILFKPVKTNIVEAHIQVQSLLKSEYSPKEQSLTGSE
ncbi:hypothetical protein Q3G72_023994 [Acer saccharum]|nr:hypothetical protein Q3G72_023994 [Acer saccharum]